MATIDKQSPQTDLDTARAETRRLEKAAGANQKDGGFMLMRLTSSSLTPYSLFRGRSVALWDKSVVLHIHGGLINCTTADSHAVIKIVYKQFRFQLFQQLNKPPVLPFVIQINHRFDGIMKRTR